MARMTRADQLELARQMRAKGASYRAIARATGLHISTVWRVLNPERAAEVVRASNARRHEAKLAWAHEHDRETCPNCGGRMGVGSKRKHTRLCESCRRSAERTRVHKRRERIQALWNDGRAIREVAAVLDSTPGSIQVELVRMRKEGWYVPCRYPANRERRAA